MTARFPTHSFYIFRRHARVTTYRPTGPLTVRWSSAVTSYAFLSLRHTAVWVSRRLYPSRWILHVQVLSSPARSAATGITGLTDLMYVQAFLRRTTLAIPRSFQAAQTTMVA